MKQIATSDFKLGIMAGGQLGKMLALAASKWDIKTHVLDSAPHAPASTVCSKFVEGSHLDYIDVMSFGRKLDMITFEIEHVNFKAIKELEAQGVKISPSPAVLELISDKGTQKQFYADENIPTSNFHVFKDANEVIQAINDGVVSIPFVQKSRKDGYDGKGVQLIKSEADLNKLFNVPNLIEDLIDIDKELSVIVARNEKGQMACFPLVEMDFNEEANLVEQLNCPAQVSPKIESAAIEMAKKTASKLEIVGLLAVELFLTKSGDLMVNESAPRTHNSGHHTIETTGTSQYEQQLRAILNFELGSTELKQPAVMLNLLGEPGYTGKVRFEGFEECLGIPGVNIHIYGKEETRPFRKMGHITITDSTIEGAKAKAEKVKNTLKVKSWEQ